MVTTRNVLALFGLLAIVISIVPAASAHHIEAWTGSWSDTGIYIPRTASPFVWNDAGVRSGSLSDVEEAARIRDVAADRWQSLGAALIRDFQEGARIRNVAADRWQGLSKAWR